MFTMFLNIFLPGWSYSKHPWYIRNKKQVYKFKLIEKRGQNDKIKIKYYNTPQWIFGKMSLK